MVVNEEAIEAEKELRSQITLTSVRMSIQNRSSEATDHPSLVRSSHSATNASIILVVRGALILKTKKMLARVFLISYAPVTRQRVTLRS
jgi:hypothetical protein